jgi:hypothetical protein
MLHNPYFSIYFDTLQGPTSVLHALPQSPDTPTTLPDTPQSLLKSVVFDPVSAGFWSRSTLFFHAIRDPGMMKCGPEHPLAVPKHAQSNPGPFPMTFGKSGFWPKNVTFLARHSPKSDRIRPNPVPDPCWPGHNS